MLRGKKFIVISIIVAVVLVGAVAGVALAQAGGTETQSQGKTLLGRVAVILGIDQQRVEDAFSRAKREMADEALDARLKALVENGKMTQEQADQYKKWWQARPETAPLLPDRMGRHAGRGFAPGMRWQTAPTTTPGQ